jgi:nanoRNase/pAp phosphatase (c-di-AMP/oligoRNAs hydrolase)
MANGNGNGTNGHATAGKPALSPRLAALAAVLPEAGRVLIIPHDYPDPDAFASAAAMHLLLKEKFGVHSRIVFTGMVNRAENREMLKHCRYGFTFATRLQLGRKRPAALVLDGVPWSGRVTVPPGARIVGVIDHHPQTRAKQGFEGLMDFRPGTGATASIMYEYLKEAGVPVPAWLAALLLYAIATETMDFSRRFTPLDLEAYSALLPGANMQILGEIRHAALPRSYFALLREAMDHAQLYGRIAWTHLDAVEHPEIVPEIADLLSRIERVTWTFCTGWRGDEMLISMRSSQPGARCGRLLRTVIGARGSAGGHFNMAAGQVDLTGKTPTEREELREELVRALVGWIERRSADSEEPFDTQAHPLVAERVLPAP